MEARRNLAAQIAVKKVEPEPAFQQALQWDPCDGVALMALARAREEAGDLAGAEQYAWRGLEAHACNFRFYLGLSHLLASQHKDQALIDGLAELGFRKVLGNEDSLEEMERGRTDWLKEYPGEGEGVFDRAEMERLVGEVARGRVLESPGVTDVLRPYRLIHELQEAPEDGLDRAVVDRILEHGARCVPLLIGVLRGWAEGDLPAGDDFPAEASLALLGEIGDPAALPALLEFFVLDNEPLAQTTGWGITRIASRRPAEALEAFRKLVPGAGGAKLAALADHMARMPPTAGTGEVLLSLLEGVENLPKADRNDLFPIVIMALLRDRAGRGRELAKSAISRHAGLLSRETRATCHELVEVSAVQPQLLAESLAQDSDKRSVYDICCERQQAEPEDEEPPPAVRRSRPGRNDPCWCGSGKKYKKCHLAADERGPKGGPEPAPRPSSASERPGGVDWKLRERLFAFMHETLGPRDIEDACSMHFGTSSREPATREEEQIAFLDWLLHDYIPRCLGRTVIEEFLERRRARLTSQECRILEGWVNSRYRLVEVQEVERGAGVHVKDLLTGELFFVRDVSSSKRMVRWDCCLARVLESEDRKELSGAALLVPRNVCPRLREWILEDQRRSGLPWPRYLRANSHRLRLKALEMCEEAVAGLQVVNAEGDPLVFSKAVYQVRDGPALLAALDGCNVMGRIDPPSGGGSEVIEFTWYEQPPSGAEQRRVMGSVRIKGDRLNLEVNSRQRLKRGKKMLAALAPGSLKLLADEITDLETIKRKAAAAPSEPAAPKLPPEVERELVQKFLDEHYRKWPDTPLPALGGKTPRQAVRTSDGRAQVVELFKFFENAQERERREGHAGYDFSWLKAELGIEI